MILKKIISVPNFLGVGVESRPLVSKPLGPTSTNGLETNGLKAGVDSIREACQLVLEHPALPRSTVRIMSDAKEQQRVRQVFRVINDRSFAHWEHFLPRTKNIYQSLKGEFPALPDSFKPRNGKLLSFCRHYIPEMRPSYLSDDRIPTESQAMIDDSLTVLVMMNCLLDDISDNVGDMFLPLIIQMKCVHKTPGISFKDIDGFSADQLKACKAYFDLYCDLWLYACNLMGKSCGVSDLHSQDSFLTIVSPEMDKVLDASIVSVQLLSVNPDLSVPTIKIPEERQMFNVALDVFSPGMMVHVFHLIQAYVLARVFSDTDYLAIFSANIKDTNKSLKSSRLANDMATYDREMVYPCPDFSNSLCYLDESLAAIFLKSPALVDASFVQTYQTKKDTLVNQAIRYWERITESIQDLNLNRACHRLLFAYMLSEYFRGVS